MLYYFCRYNKDPAVSMKVISYMQITCCGDNFLWNRGNLCFQHQRNSSVFPPFFLPIYPQLAAFRGPGLRNEFFCPLVWRDRKSDPEVDYFIVALHLVHHQSSALIFCWLLRPQTSKSVKKHLILSVGFSFPSQFTRSRSKPSYFPCDWSSDTDFFHSHGFTYLLIILLVIDN